jgi:hypothetical protein
MDHDVQLPRDQDLGRDAGLGEIRGLITPPRGIDKILRPNDKAK